MEGAARSSCSGSRLRTEVARLGEVAELRSLPLAGWRRLAQVPGEMDELLALLPLLCRLEDLDISSCAIEELVVRELAVGFVRVPWLRRLSLRGNRLGLEGAAALAKETALPTLARLRSLDLTSCGIDAFCMEILAPGLGGLHSLESLSLGGNAFGAAGFESLASAAFPSLAQLGALHLAAFVRLDVEACEALAAGLIHLQALTDLDLSCCGLTGGAFCKLRPGLLSVRTVLSRLQLRKSVFGTDGARALAEVLPQLTSLRDLDLSQCGFVVGSVQGLAQGLGPTGLERLSLEGAEVGPEDAKALAGVALPQCAALKDLDLSGCNIDTAAGKELASGLRHLHGLEALRLCHNKFGTEAAEAFSREAFPHLPQLRRLDLRGCDLTRPAVEALAPPISQWEHLDTLDFGDKKVMGQFVRALSLAQFPSAPKLRSITSLDLESAGLTSTFLTQTAAGLCLLPDLENLQLKSNEFGENGTAALAKGLAALLKLKSLNLTDCGIVAGTLQALAPSLGTLAGLERLHLRGNEIGVTGVQALAEGALQHLSQLRELVLASCELDAECMQELAPGLASNTKLERLVLSFNDFGVEGMQRLARAALPDLHCLKELALGSCGLDAQALQELAACFKHMPELEKLALASNSLCTEGAQAFAQEAGSLTRLKELELQYCDFDEEAIVHIAQALSGFLDLRRLILMGNVVGTRGAQALAREALPCLRRLQDLNLSYGHLCADAMCELAKGLQHLEALEALSLRNNKFGPEGARALAEHACPKLGRLGALDLRFCGLDAPAVKAIAPQLGQLDQLSSLQVDDSTLLIAFITGLSHCDPMCPPQFRMFKELALDRCALTPELLQEVFRGLRYVANLEVLSVRGNTLGVRGAAVLASDLPQLSKLRRLHLASCGFGLEALRLLIPSVAMLQELEVLNVMGNVFGAEGATELVEALLPRLAKLQELNVMGCTASSEAAAAANGAAAG